MKHIRRIGECQATYAFRALRRSRPIRLQQQAHRAVTPLSSLCDKGSLQCCKVFCVSIALIKKYLVSEETGYGSRVAKYRHRFCNTEYGTLKFTPQELGIVCELLLRGPQTPGELRSRASRLCSLKDVTEAEAVLDRLARREDGPFVVRLPREPGKRESRYAHLFGGDVEESLASEAEGASAMNSMKCEQLEQRVARLESEMAELKALLIRHDLT